MSSPEITAWRRPLLFHSRVVRLGSIGFILAAMGLSSIFHSPSAAASEQCAYTSPQQVAATPDTELDNMFQDYGNTASGTLDRR